MSGPSVIANGENASYELGKPNFKGGYGSARARNASTLAAKATGFLV